MKSDAKPRRTSEDGCVHERDTSSVDLPEFEAGVLFQTFTSDREGELFGFRIFEDGRKERLRPGTEWSQSKKLPSESLEKLREALEASELGSVAGVHRPSELPDDASFGIVQAGPDPARAVVYFKPCRVEAVDELFERIGPLL